MITRTKISAVRASGVRRLLTFFSQMRLFEGGVYSSNYGIRLCNEILINIRGCFPTLGVSVGTKDDCIRNL